MFKVYELKITKINNDKNFECEIRLFMNKYEAFRFSHEEAKKYILQTIKYNENGCYEKRIGEYEHIIEYESIVDEKYVDLKSECIFYTSSEF